VAAKVATPGELDAAAVPGSARARAGAAAGAWLWATAGLSAGAFAVAIILAPPASASPARGLGWVLFVASSGHVASTGWFYGSGQVRAHVARHRWRYIWVPLVLVLGTAAAAAVLPPRTMAWLLLPYFAWQFFHFQKQNLGLAALAATSCGAPSLTRGERRAIVAAGYAGITGLLAHPALLQVAVNPGLGTVFPVAGIAFGVAAVGGLALFLRRPPAARPAGLAITYVMAQAFFLPVFTFASPYAAVGGLTIAHGAQYLLLMSLVAGGKGSRGPGTRAPGTAGPGIARALRLTVLVNIVLLGGTVLEVASHLHDGGRSSRVLYGMYLGVVMAHFVIDAGLWRLRDPFPRRFLASRVPYLLAAREPSPARSGDLG
jgi:hypothetical protein